MGAFLVEARYRALGRVVDAVRIFSERGKACVLQSPFDGAGIAVTRADNRQPVPVLQDEEEFTFRTTAGVTYEIARAEYPPTPVGAPVIKRHPTDATVVLSDTAKFTVSAAGQSLSYQWQRNRADIPGATSPSYTTLGTTLWDIGSAYRCVVSNASGLTRSRPGILHSAGSPSVARHSILGVWSYRHAGRDYTREFKSDGQCTLRDGGQVGWTKAYSVVDEHTVLVEGKHVHRLTGADTLNIENVFNGKRMMEVDPRTADPKQ